MNVRDRRRRRIGHGRIPSESLACTSVLPQLSPVTSSPWSTCRGTDRNRRRSSTSPSSPSTPPRWCGRRACASGWSARTARSRLLSPTTYTASATSTCSRVRAWARVADDVHAAIRGRVLDTARLAKLIWPRLPGGYGLDRLVTHAGLHPPDVQPGERRHRAGYETWMTGQLLIVLVQGSGLSWGEIVDGAGFADVTA
jgi:hypothetical protein